MKLEIKHLAPYLPYKLKALSIDGFSVSILGVDFTTNRILNINGDRTFTIAEIKPLLRQLSDYADINSDAMNSLNCDMSEQINLNEFAIGYICLGSLYQSTYDLCLKNHIDVFGLINHGLALPLI